MRKETCQDSTGLIWTLGRQQATQDTPTGIVNRFVPRHIGLHNIHISKLNAEGWSTTFPHTLCNIRFEHLPSSIFCFYLFYYILSLSLSLSLCLTLCLPLCLPFFFTSHISLHCCHGHSSSPHIYLVDILLLLTIANPSLRSWNGKPVFQGYHPGLDRTFKIVPSSLVVHVS